MRKIVLKAYKKLLMLISRRNLRNVFYIGSGEFLPPPLTQEEENALLPHLDDREVRNTVIERNLRLVVFIARRFDNTGVAMDDLVSIGAVGLVKAVSTFSTDKNIKLATYAARCIENEILMYLRKTSRYKQEVSLDEPLNVDWDGNELLLSDVLGTDGDLVTREYEDESDIAMLKKALQRLKPREREIISLRYGLDGRAELTQKEVADMMGISQSYISRLEKRIIDTLRKEIC